MENVLSHLLLIPKVNGFTVHNHQCAYYCTIEAAFIITSV